MVPRVRVGSHSVAHDYNGHDFRVFQLYGGTCIGLYLAEGVCVVTCVFIGHVTAS